MPNKNSSPPLKSQAPLLTTCLDQVMPEEAVLDVTALAATLSALINTLGLASVVDAPNVLTLRYYRRDTVRILSPPVSAQGGYTRRHLLEALYARLTAAAKTATLEGAAKSLTQLSDHALLKATSSLVKTVQASATALASTTQVTPYRSPISSVNAAALNLAPSHPAPRFPEAPSALAAWPLPDGATLLLPTNHPAFNSPAKCQEFTSAVKNILLSKLSNA